MAKDGIRRFWPTLELQGRNAAAANPAVAKDGDLVPICGQLVRGRDTNDASTDDCNSHQFRSFDLWLCDPAFDLKRNVEHGVISHGGSPNHQPHWQLRR